MSEHPSSNNVVDINEYRLKREGTRFGLSEDEEQIDLHKYTGSPYDRKQIDQTLATVSEKRAELSAEVVMIRNITRLTDEIIVARIDNMEISERPFMKEAS